MIRRALLLLGCAIVGLSLACGSKEAYPASAPDVPCYLFGNVAEELAIMRDLGLPLSEAVHKTEPEVESDAAKGIITELAVIVYTHPQVSPKVANETVARICRETWEQAE